MFFGGRSPSKTFAVLNAQFESWLGQASNVVHFDFHTGLGASATFKLLVDYPLSDDQRALFSDSFGLDSFEVLAGGAPDVDSNERVAYSIRGGLGRWCVTRAQRNYLFAAAEFGTSSPLEILAAMVEENQIHHHGPEDTNRITKAKTQLMDAFCPSNQVWRSEVLRAARELIGRAVVCLQRQDSVHDSDD